ncbi:TPA: LysE family translocator [Salmonella enterica subsp. enterica serovar Bovismorbificans]
MSLTALMAFALIMSAGIVTPGPTVLLSLHNAARFGIKRALWGISGAVVADVLLVALVWLGLGVVLAASETPEMARGCMACLYWLTDAAFFRYFSAWRRGCSRSCAAGAFPEKLFCCHE